jgi:hypothetical protein
VPVIKIDIGSTSGRLSEKQGEISLSSLGGFKTFAVAKATFGGRISFRFIAGKALALTEG